MIVQEELNESNGEIAFTLKHKCTILPMRDKYLVLFDILAQPLAGQ